MTYKDKIVSINDNKLARFTMDIELSDNITKTKDGYLLCKNVTMGRTGYQKYYGYELVGFDFEPDEVVEVLRDESEVFAIDTMNSANGKPVTLGHPSDGVNIDNIKELGKGSILGVPKRVGDNLVGDIIITDKQLVKLIEKKKLRELSLGYQTLLKRDENNVVKQTEIYINHLAVVESGRAGNAMIIDEDTIKNKEGGNVVELLKDKTLNITINLSDLLKKDEEKEEKVEEKKDEDKKEEIVDEKEQEKEVKKEDEDAKEKEVDDEESKEEELKEDEKGEEPKKEKEKEIVKDMKAEDLIKIINEMNDEQKNQFKSFIGDAQVKTNAFTNNKQVNNEPTMVNDYSSVKGDERDKYLQEMHDSKFSFRNMYNKSNGNSVELKRVIYQAKDIEVKDLVGGIK